MSMVSGRLLNCGGDSKDQLEMAEVGFAAGGGCDVLRSGTSATLILRCCLLVPTSSIVWTTAAAAAAGIIPPLPRRRRRRPSPSPSICPPSPR